MVCIGSNPRGVLAGATCVNGAHAQHKILICLSEAVAWYASVAPCMGGTIHVQNPIGKMQSTCAFKSSAAVREIWQRGGQRCRVAHTKAPANEPQRRVRQRHCGGKRCFATYTEARAAALTARHATCPLPALYFYVDGHHSQQNNHILYARHVCV
jgi:hypothetical protein